MAAIRVLERCLFMIHSLWFCFVSGSVQTPLIWIHERKDGIFWDDTRIWVKKCQLNRNIPRKWVHNRLILGDNPY